jgi:hypothetical protein
MAFIGNQIITLNSLLDLDGQELVLDADADSTIHVSTDDQIDFKIGGTDVATFTNSSSDFVITQAVQDKDIIFKGDDGGSAITALTLDMSEAGNASFNGTVTANAGVVVDNITIDGTEIDLSSGDLTIDVAGDITLDANGQQIFFAKGGTTFGQTSTESTPANFTFECPISDGDIIFKGNDGGSGIEIARFDVSEGGDFLLNKTSSDSGTAGHELLDYGRAVHTANATTVQVVNRLSSDGDIAIFQKDGSTVGAIASSSGDLLIDAPADIILDADGGQIRFKDAGTEIGVISNSSNDLQIVSSVSNADMIFRGNDGGTPFNALTLDMSEAGNASFNGRVTANAGVVVDNITIDGTEIDVSSGDLTLDVANNIILNADGNQIMFADGSTSYGRITSNSSDLTLQSDISDQDITFKGNDGGNFIEAMRIDMSAAGRVYIASSSEPTSSVAGIQLSNPTLSAPKISVGGTTSEITHLTFINGNGGVGQIKTQNTTTSYVTSSDYRLKENIVTDWDATTRLKQLKPSRFNFKTDKATTMDGFLAHEVSSIVPEAITGEKDAVDEDGNIDPQGIDQAKLVPLLTKALQEAISEIDTLKAKVTALESK